MDLLQLYNLLSVGACKLYVTDKETGDEWECSGNTETEVISQLFDKDDLGDQDDLADYEVDGIYTYENEGKTIVAISVYGRYQ